MNNIKKIEIKIDDDVFNKYVKTHNDSKVKTTSGVLDILYGFLGKEISKVLSNTIRNGTGLEKLISIAIEDTIENSEYSDFYKIKTLLDYNNVMDEFNSHRINDDTFDLSDRVYLIKKSVFKDIKHGDKRIQPDLLSIIVKNGKIDFYVIEIKMGDNFDTKKSAAEKEHLTIFSEKLNVITGVNKVYKILPFFSNTSKDKLSKYGFKNVFSEEEILTRNELSELFGINFDGLIELYSNVKETNITMFINNICEDSDIRMKILNNTNVKKDVINKIKNILKNNTSLNDTEIMTLISII